MTLEKRSEGKKFYSNDKKWRQYYSSFAASLAVTNFGTTWSWTVTAIPDINSNTMNPMSPFTPRQESWLTAITYLGALAVCPLAGLLIQKLGVRRSMLTMSIPLIGGWVLITFSNTFWMLFLGRLITGFCAGGATIAQPLFIAETTEAEIRGKLGVGYGLFGSFGQLYIFLIGYWVSWQWQAVACGLLPILFQLLLVAVPETPVTLISQNKIEKAQASLAWYRHAPRIELVQEEFDSMVKAVEISKVEKGPINIMDYMTPAVLKPTAICFILMIFNVTCGVTSVLSYTVEIFKTAGVDDSYLATVIVGFTKTVMTFPCAILVDRIGRRVLLIISGLFMASNLIVLGGYMYWQTIFSDYTWIPLVCLVLLMTGFSLGFGPIPFILAGELVPPGARGFSSAVISIAIRSSAFLAVLFFNDVNDLFGNHGCYWLFAGTCIIASCFVYFYVPETKGKSLEEIQFLFQTPSQEVEIAGTRGQINSC